ncbi:MAG: menaquinol oxidoreductase [Desulfuromonadaceae bacterium]|nr:menaquinol oxidoreductase [Desulfuromonadaceae bacterium]
MPHSLEPQKDGVEDRLRRPEQRVARIQAHIDELHTLSRQGLLGLAVFFVISLIAVYFQDSNILAYVSPETRDLLGRPPSPLMINIALAVYSFSALILTLARLADRTEQYKGWSHVGYLVVFYIFYAFAHALRVNVLAVIVAGTTILGLEWYSLWSYAREAIKREKGILRKLLRQRPQGSQSDFSEDEPSGE